QVSTNQVRIRKALLASELVREGMIAAVVLLLAWQATPELKHHVEAGQRVPLSIHSGADGNHGRVDDSSCLWMRYSLLGNSTTSGSMAVFCDMTPRRVSP